ncbi:hypothetical protein K470DRAFT_258127 [Piedraia hortae CBS 480.64]|uniref:Uncharacterized protein n=1 Tax=Piedraia hortae CBS 480.64 TaxID=1314780 RepID=A0A6A7BYV0_9PEZI|nr:hypothetical protein K470DRAFT_258127 [Piedraia hortae CBS 480.64]
MSGPSTLPQAATDPPMPEPDQPLQDVRKGRAKGPKKRNAGGALAGVSAAESPAPKEDSLEALKPATEEAPAAISTIPSAEVSRPQAPAGSAGAIMTASLKGPAPTIPRKQVPSQASPTLAPKSPNSSSAKPNPYPATFNEQHKATTLGGDDKENADDERPMVKSPPGIRGPRPLPPSATRSRPQSSSSKDDEATTRPASQASSAPGFWSGLGRLVGKTNDSLSTPPPPPRKSSRVVSGQLQQDKERQDSR